MTSFRVFSQFTGRTAPIRNRRLRVRPKHAEVFAGDDLPSRFARALCEENALPLKELLEGFEFFQAVRRQVAAPRVADLCAGHGLVGVLFALFERKVESVTVLDRVRPDSFDRVLAAADRIGPWTRPKVTYEETGLEQASRVLARGTSIVAVHACGLRTDRAIDLAVELNGAVACLPCCRPHRNHPASEVLKRELGGDVAIDVHRTHVLEQAGYQVRWTRIAETITPMNRILVGTAPADVAVASGTQK